MIDSLQRLIEAVKMLVTWWFFVEPWETAIRVRAGKHTAVCGPGAHFRVPILDRVYMHNMRRMVQACPAATISSRDGAVYVVGVTVSFCVVDAVLLHQSAHDPWSVVNQKVAQAVAEYVHGNDAMDVRPDGLSVTLGGVDLSSFGIGELEVCVGNFARVQTYRLIQDQLSFYQSADTQLSTTRKI